MAKRISVVLNQTVSKLGIVGEVVEVAPGYARNFLYPRDLAQPVTPAVLKVAEFRRAKEEARLAALKAEAEARKAALEALGTLSIAKQVGEEDAIFGTVTNGDVADAIQAKTGQELDRRSITLPDVHQLGTYTVQVKLHPDVVAELTIDVVAQ